MNPDTGKLHENLARIEAAGRGERVRKSDVETPEAALKRAEDSAREREENSTVPQGAALPPDWPRFEIGDRLGPIKGWWFKLVYADVAEQKLVIQPDCPVREGAKGRVGKRVRRKVKRTKGGTRKKRRRTR